MLNVTRKQLTTMSLSRDADLLAETVHRILEVLQGVSLVRPHLEKLPAAQVVQEVILAAGRLGVVDFDDLCKWSYIRIVTGVAFYERPEFRYFWMSH